MLGHLGGPDAELGEQLRIEALAARRNHREKGLVELGAAALEEARDAGPPGPTLPLQRDRLVAHLLDARAEGGKPGGLLGPHATLDDVEQDIERVDEPLPARRPDDGRLDELAASLLHGQQARSEVPAVHRGDVAGRQRREIARVVPVVEVAAVAFHPLERLERVPQAQDDGQQTRMAEIVGRQRGQLQEADVGRGGSPRDLAPRLFLEVIGWEPLVVRPDERVEEEPGATREQTEAARIAVASTPALAGAAAG